jgi:Right handed beta helix region
MLEQGPILRAQFSSKEPMTRLTRGARRSTRTHVSLGLLGLLAACGSGGEARSSGSGDPAYIQVTAGDAAFAVQIGSSAALPSHSWTMSNPSSSTYFFDIRVDQPWVLLQTPATGSIAPLQDALVTVTIDNAALGGMTAGNYSASVQFRNSVGDVVDFTRAIALTLTDGPPPPPPPGGGGSGGGTTTAGWTTLAPSPDSIVVYVSSSIGNDANNGLTEQTPKRTFGAAKALLRTGFPDWMRLKKGDVWTEGIGNWDKRGRSITEPQVITSYGTGARPLLSTGGNSGLTGMGGGSRPWLAVVDLHFRGRDGAPTSAPAGLSFLTPVEGLLIEGCLIERYNVAVVIQGLDGRFRNVRLRRNVIVDQYSVDSSHAGGTYLSGIDDLLIEGNIFDRNGWIPGVPQATPPTIFRHHIYVQNDCTNTTVRGNYLLNSIANAVSMRSNGVIEDNVCARNSIALLLGAVGGSATVRRNIVMDGKDIDTPNPRGWGIDIKHLTNGVVVDNLIINNTLGTFPVAMVVDATAGTPVNGLRIERNLFYNWGGGVRLNGNGSVLTNVRLIDNQLQDLNMTGPLLVHSDAASVASIVESRGNRLWRQAGASTWIQNGPTAITLSAWMGLVNDTTSTMQLVAPTEPSRGLATYHASLGKTATHDAFVTEVRKQSKDNWRTDYDPAAVATWIRQGFGMTVQ